MKVQKNTTWLLGILCAVMLTTSCIGPMNASGRVKTWNRKIENRWLGEGVFLVFRYFPVYTACFLGDVLIFNSIEFWGGKNPIKPPKPEDIERVKELDAERMG